MKLDFKNANIFEVFEKKSINGSNEKTSSFIKEKITTTIKGTKIKKNK